MGSLGRVSPLVPVWRRSSRERSRAAHGPSSTLCTSLPASAWSPVGSGKRPVLTIRKTPKSVRQPRMSAVHGARGGRRPSSRRLVESLELRPVSLAIRPLAGLSSPGDMTQFGVQFRPLPGAEGRVPWAFLHSVRCLAWGLTLKLTEAPSVCGGNSGKVRREGQEVREGNSHRWP